MVSRDLTDLGPAVEGEDIHPSFMHMCVGSGSTIRMDRGSFSAARRGK